MTGVTGFRGMFASVATLYLAYGDTLFRVGSPGGPLTLIGGGFTGTGPVQFAANNRSPTPDKVAVTANGAFTFTDTLIAAYPDSDLPVPAGVALRSTATSYFRSATAAALRASSTPRR